VDVVEAHGTGTRLGDPIEAQALIATYGQDRAEGQPLWLGSVKSNIGHTQAAAGVAGVIKMIQALRHEELPPTLHTAEPTPQVDWSAGDVRLLAEAVPWPAGERPRRAGVSSFGISGTNAHVILEEAPAEPPAGPAENSLPGVAQDGPGDGVPRLVPWLVSARSQVALAAQARRLAEWAAARPGLDPADVGFSLATARTAHEYRAVVTGRGGEELVGGLAALARGEEAPGVVAGAGGTLAGGKTAFVFSGQGSQRAGMGLGLYAASPVFAAAFDEVCGYLDGHLDRPIREVIGADGELLDQTGYAQPGLFAVQVALFRLLESWGVVPGLVAGHSVGELAAAHVAGVLSLADACALVAARGALMQALPGGGAMVAVQASEEEVAPLLAGRGDLAGVAAVNGPASVVVSGQEAVVLEVAGYWGERGRKTRRLRVSHAFHSPLMDPMLGEYRAVAEGVRFAEPRVPLVCGVTGRLAEPGELAGAGYWVRNVREPVRFADAVAALRGAGARSFVEVGPDAALTAMGAEVTADDTGVAWLPAMRRGRDEAQSVLAALAGLHVRGHGVDWSAFWAGTGARRVELPTYAFQHQRYWMEARPGSVGDVTSAGLETAGHPLLSAALQLPGSGAVVLTGRVSPAAHPWLADHVVAGRVLLPGTAFVELAVRAGDEAGCPVIEELVIEAPLVLPANGAVQVRVEVAADGADGRRPVQVFSRRENAGDGRWTRHAAGTLVKTWQEAPSGPPVSLVAWPPPGAGRVDLSGLYARLAADGLDYGPAFQGLRAAWRRGGEVFAELALPGDAGEAGGFGLHPALLDAVLHASRLLEEAGEWPRDGIGETRLPFAWRGVRLHASGASVLRARVSADAGGGGLAVAAADAAGAPVASVDSLVLRPLPAAADLAAPAVLAGLFQVEWVPV
jgi:acyl transferase domain-containing protein